jgi:hypothetical protein
MDRHTATSQSPLVSAVSGYSHTCILYN